MDRVERFAARLPFALDDFQRRACEAVALGRSVIVSAPTGAGKTLVAEFAITEALERGRRLAYTTPLKALSNQKYGDFVRAYGADTVGILTGDVKVNPSGRVLVMTTEILRNMFYSGGLDELAYVVLDECHYMGDEGRGTVWEEVVVNAPSDAQLVALSATVANVAEIADWIGLVHRPIDVVAHTERPVPLSWALVDLGGDLHTLDAVRAGRARVAGDESRDGGGRRRWFSRRVAAPAGVIEALETRRWLPAIYFIFSRAGCERAMHELLTEGRPLIDRAQRREVDAAIAEAVAESPSLGESELAGTICSALRAGVAVHHAGVLPSAKRLIERLFERGLCRAVFATETMSLGIHMPARSVVLQGLTKRTDRGFRSLTHNELTQMAGRAGRRGIDPEGQCVIALDARDTVADTLAVVDGAPEPVESRFRLGYGSVALLLSTGLPPAALRRRVEASFGQYQNLKRVRVLEGEVADLEAEALAAGSHAAPCGEFARIGRYRAARLEADARRRQLGRGGRRGERSLADLEPGRLALVRRRGGPSLGAVVGIHAIRGHRVLVDVLLVHGAVVRAKSAALKQVFWATPPLALPRDRGRAAAGSGRGLTAAVEQLARLDLEALLAHERAASPEEAMAASACHRCRWSARPTCEAAWRTHEERDGRAGRARELLDEAREAYWREFLGLVEILEQFGAVADGQLTPKGRLVAALRHDNELLVAEVVARRLLDDLKPAEAAAVCAALGEEPRSGEPALVRAFFRDQPRLRRRFGEVEGVAAVVFEAQRQRRLGPGVAVHPGYMPAVFRWASGDDDWAGLVAETWGGHEGDLIRAMRRLLDILRQLAGSADTPPATARALAHAARVIDRGVVLESALL